MDAYEAADRKARNLIADVTEQVAGELSRFQGKMFEINAVKSSTFETGQWSIVRKTVQSLSRELPMLYVSTIGHDIDEESAASKILDHLSQFIRSVVSTRFVSLVDQFRLPVTENLKLALFELDKASDDSKPKTPVPSTVQNAATDIKGTPLMNNQSGHALRVFIAFSAQDDEHRVQIEKHSSLLCRQGKISLWNFRRISPGRDWEGQIDEHLDSADIILLLVSSDFLASNYCFDVEMKRALERHDMGNARVIPIIVRPCLWDSAPFSKLQALPKDGMPVTDWPCLDQAYADIARGIGRVVDELTETGRIIISSDESTAFQNSNRSNHAMEAKKIFDEYCASLKNKTYFKGVEDKGIWALAIFPGVSSIKPGLLTSFDELFDPICREGRTHKRTGRSKFVYSQGKGNRVPCAVTEITNRGEVKAYNSSMLENRGLAALELELRSPLCEREIIKKCHLYLSSLKTYGVSAPFYLHSALLGIKGCWMVPEGPHFRREFQGDDIRPDPICLTNESQFKTPEDVAATLMPMFDYVWGEFGYDYRLYYSATGDWIGGW